MKFMRRADLDTQTRIDIVMLAWLNRGVYGKMTQIAAYYQISRTFLYQLMLMTHLHLEILFSEENALFEREGAYLERMVLLLRLEGKCSLGSISEILRLLDLAPHSPSYLSSFLQNYALSLPSTLFSSPERWVFYLSDEIFAIGKPILVTIEPKSTTILKIELAEDRCALTWQKHFETLKDHNFYSLGMASDRGLGLRAGYQLANPNAPWISDHFHELQDLFKLVAQFEKKAEMAIEDEAEEVRKFNNAKSESHLNKRLKKYERAEQKALKAIVLYDEYFLLSQLLREALQLFSPEGKLRTVAGVGSELGLLFEMMEALSHPAIEAAVKTLKNHFDDILVPFERAEEVYSELLESVPRNALDFLCLAWHHDHLIYQSKAKIKRTHQRESLEWLAWAEAILGKNFESLKQLVFEQLDSLIRASSLVEMVNSLIRPYLNSAKGQITQETLNLIMFYHNHHRYKSGKREGKAPLEILTGKELKGEWVDLLIEKAKEWGEANHKENRANVIPLEKEDDWSTHQKEKAQMIFDQLGGEEEKTQNIYLKAA